MMKDQPSHFLVYIQMSIYKEAKLTLHVQNLVIINMGIAQFFLNSFTKTCEQQDQTEILRS